MDRVKEWLTLPKVAWVNDPDRESSEVIEELLVKHVFGDSDKPLTPTCKIEAPGVRVRFYKTEKGGDYGWGAKDVPVVSGLVLRKREGEWTGHSRPPYKAVPLHKRLVMAKRRFSFQFSGYLEIAICGDARNSGKTTGMIELNPVRPTPIDAVLKGKRHPFVSLYHTLPDGSECRVEPLGSLEVAEKDLLFHLDNMRRFVKGNQAQESRLEQLVTGDSEPEQATGLNIVSVPVKSLVVPLAPAADEVKQAEVEKQEDDSRNMGGRPTEFLTEALQHAYQECRDRGDTSILDPGQLHAFLKHLQKLSGGSRNKESVSEYIEERIAVVQPSDLVECVKTHERAVDGKPYKKGDWYSQNDISIRMNSLRKKNPLSPQKNIQ